MTNISIENENKEEVGISLNAMVCNQTNVGKIFRLIGNTAKNTRYLVCINTQVIILAHDGNSMYVLDKEACPGSFRFSEVKGEIINIRIESNK